MPSLKVKKKKSHSKSRSKSLKNLDVQINSLFEATKGYVVTHPSLIYKGLGIVIFIYMFYPLMWWMWQWFPWIWAGSDIYVKYTNNELGNHVNKLITKASEVKLIKDAKRYF